VIGPDRAVTIIIPTLGLRERAASLQCAIESALSQDGVRPTVVVVLNGPNRSPQIERALRADPRITLISRAARGLPAALAAGRALVSTLWFTSLDDDDLLLPGALLLRICALESSPDCAAVITNGYRRTEAGDELHVQPDHRVRTDPVRAMLDANWFLPGSWLCRTDMVGVNVFQDMPDFLECTYLGLRIATEHRIVWRETPTVIYTVGSPGAESQSRAYILGQVRGLRRVLSLSLPADVRRALRARIAAAYHAAADHDRTAGAIRRAWRWHVASLLQPSGWRYVAYTRHLMRDAWLDRS
jgi:glycosyltransferase involved in cell wall biosynthesis